MATVNPNMTMNLTELMAMYKSYEAQERIYTQMALSDPSYINAREQFKMLKTQVQAQIQAVTGGIASGITSTIATVAKTTIEAALRDPAQAQAIGLNVPSSAIDGYLGVLVQNGEVSGTVLQQYRAQVQMGYTPTLDEVRDALLRAGLTRLTPDTTTTPPTAGTDWKKIALIGLGAAALGTAAWLLMRDRF